MTVIMNNDRNKNFKKRKHLVAIQKVWSMKKEKTKDQSRNICPNVAKENNESLKVSVARKKSDEN